MLSPMSVSKLSINTRVLLYFSRFQMRPKYRLNRIIVILFSILSVLSWDIAVPYFFKDLIDTITPLTPPLEPGVINTILTPITLMAAAYCLGFIFNVGIHYATSICSPIIIRDMEQEAFEKVQSFSYDFYADNFIGALVAQIRRLSDAYLSIEFEVFENLFKVITKIIAVFLAIYFFAPSALFYTMFWAASFLIIVKLMLTRKMQHDRKAAAYDSEATSTLADSLGNFLSTIIFNGHEREKQRFYKSLSKKTDYFKKSWLWSCGIFATQYGLNIVIQLFILYACVMLWTQGQISVGSIVFLQSLFMNLSNTLVEFGNSLKSIYRSLAKAEEMVLTHELQPSLKDTETPISSKITAGKIQFKDVQFSYGDKKNVFSNFNVTIKPGEKIGIVGPSGSGKSTFVKLLLRFMDPESGRILIDGQDISHITMADLRENISYVPQEPALFHRSLSENIAYGRPNADFEDIKKVAKDAYIDDFIDGLPEGYDTLVGERGIKLSGGERQRIAIARAMIKKSPILVLDEATSSLDTQGEKYIKKAFEKLMKNRTTIVIAHRLSTIAQLDRILVLNKGEIVEDGTHAALLKIKNGLYAQLYKNQKDGMIEG